MKILFHIFLVIGFQFFFTGIYAQQYSFLEKAYGLDPLLYNGKLYTYNIPANTGGTPFLNGPGFTVGSVRIRGINYENLLLKYDLLNQLLILKYKNSVGAETQIELSDAWLESFHLGNADFEMLAIQDTLRRVYQVIGTGPKRILYLWSKNMELDSRLGATNYVFSRSNKEAYLLTGCKLFQYKNNRSFVRLFDLANQTVLKKYLLRQKLNVKKAPDKAINELINYCNTLSLK